ncbi:TRAP transporter substrate-binding protein DctP [Marinobacter orientalis]|uniref:TRAP transporter substrate-binding protein DctP n=1 Tax=Marinobacter orientalis TaxID=1928859 RepID=A0A7Y0WT49_9GAMM|nr:TRAP transporter substrate-binding protein DctP [Marinobacter orientalis]NMT64539.1 TRAP transporter substrate-binding protein DctP [Marinobacter orientalis]TGX50508.1 C4-dicarboxylate ABC transporter [Marinobacter orientalis]
MRTLCHWQTPLFAMVILLLAGCSDSPSPTATTENEGAKPTYPVTWRFALEEIEGSVQHRYALELKERIEGIADGNILIDIFPYGSIGTSIQLTDLAREGSVHLAFASPGHLADVIPETGVFTLHFLLSDNETVNRNILASDELVQQFSKPYEEQHLELLGFVPEGWMVWTANRPLKTPADFDGLAFRTMTSEIAAEAYKAYGANPTPAPFSQVYSDLQLRRLDGQANPIFAIEEMGFYEVQSTMTFARPAQFVTSVVSNKEWFDALPEDQKRWLEEALDEVAPLVYEVQAELNASRLETIRQNSDIRTLELTEEERDRFREASLPVRDTFARIAGDRGKAILEQLIEMVDEAESEVPGT